MSVDESYPAQAVETAETSSSSWKERANTELEKIVQLFSSTQLPDLCVKALISPPEKPSSKWSFGNQLLMLLAGTTDARGFRQWTEVRRSVRKGTKATYILGPVIKKVRKTSLDPEIEEGFMDVLVGFRPIAVFRYEDTEGQDLPVYKPRNPPPLMEVAERFGMKVQYQRLAPGTYGITDHTNKTITLASEDQDVFFHELAHAIHRTFEPKQSGHGQEPEAETIAQLVAATLARLYIRPADNFSWSYIASYAQSNNPQKVGRLCMRVLDKTKKVLDLIYPDRPATSIQTLQPTASNQATRSNPYQDETRSEGQENGT
jgi:hypothetical protein